VVFSTPVFLFLFLPLTLALYALAPRSWKNPILLLLSLLFYAWGEGFFVGVMLASIGTNYLFGLGVERFRGGGGAKLVLGLGVAANLTLLGVYKYANFIIDSINPLLGAVQLSPVNLDPVHLPIGISFFTFQAMSYLIDVYRREAPARHNPLHVALYIAMFPQLIAGPIVRYSQVAKELVDRRVGLDDFAYGVRRFIIGLGKKALIANPMGATADQIFALSSGDLTSGIAWLGIICYTLQIYFDFSGYSDMAIGLGRMFGFTFPENFNYPYISRSIREFWRRWHISLSSWFRDYLYIPLGGNKKGATRTHMNLLVVFFLCGLWHGASWNFVIWGLLHGAFLVLERGPFGRMLDALPSLMRHLYVVLVVMVAWVFFRIESFPDAVAFLSAMAGMAQGDGQTQHVMLFLDNEVIVTLIAGIIGACPWLPTLGRLRERLSGATDGMLEGVSVVALVAVFLVSAMSIAAGTYNPFIYFRF